MSDTEESPKKRKSSLKSIGISIAFIVLLAVAIWSSLSYFKAQKQIAQLTSIAGQQQLAKEQVAGILTKVKKHMILPANETPTIATVTDVNTLKKSQPFFADAQNGDQVLVYVGAKKAIIYSPTKDIVINVGFVAVDDSGNAQAVATNTANTQVTPLSVDVRNGTQTAGLGQKVANTIKTEGATVQKIADAKAKTYTQTVVVDLGKLTDKSAINALATSLNAQVVTALPEGEVSSTADVLVIAGTDKVTP